MRSFHLLLASVFAISAISVPGCTTGEDTEVIKITDELQLDEFGRTPEEAAVANQMSAEDYAE